MIPFLSSPLWAQSPARPPEQAQDDVLQLRVKRALAEDAVLKNHQLNLLVNVSDGVALVNGPVPEDHLVRRVEQLVATVSGLRSQKIRCWVPATLDGDGAFIRQVQEKLEPTATKPEKPLALPPVVHSGSLPPLAISAKPAEVRGHAQSGSAQLAPTEALLNPVVSSTSFRGKERPAGAAPLPYPTIPPQQLPTQPVDDTAWSPVPTEMKKAEEPTPDWQSLLRDSRFAGLTAELTDGILIITGNATASDAPWQLAAEMRKIPGIARVRVRLGR